MNHSRKKTIKKGWHHPPSPERGQGQIAVASDFLILLFSHFGFINKRRRPACRQNYINLRLVCRVKSHWNQIKQACAGAELYRLKKEFR